MTLEAEAKQLGESARLLVSKALSASPEPSLILSLAGENKAGTNSQGDLRGQQGCA